MKFWDTSAVIPLLIDEQQSHVIDQIFNKDPAIVVWWGTSIECVSAMARLERENKITHKEAESIISRLSQIRSTWREIQPGTKLKQTAERILRLHPLRAQDSQQLAACIIANTDHQIEFVTLDERLATAARKEGLIVINSTNLS